MSDPATCNLCNGATQVARQPVPSNQQAIVEAAQADPLFTTAQWNCFCEITETGEGKPGTATAGEYDMTQQAALTDCLTNAVPAGTTNGWCYVDPTTANTQGLEMSEENIITKVDKCPSDQQQEIRFVNGGKPASGATLFITCAGT